jgi:Raf kinase inhibitor-like YbhB/YbcL family protein
VLLIALLLAAQSSLTLSTPAFQDGGPISWRYTCYNAREPSPPLTWSGVPEGAESLAVVVDGPGDRATHWLVYNLPADVPGLPEDVPRVEQLDNGGLQGMNDFGSVGYAAPCPPPLTTVTYQFTLSALDTRLALPPGASEAEFHAAAEGHTLEQATLTGTYLRPAWPWG